MAQGPKEHVRQSFVTAAGEAFAELGFEATTMAAVAERAGSSVGNLYKYFAGKQQLFDAAVPLALVQELTRRTRARIRALGAVKDVRDASTEYHDLAEDLVDFGLRHRAALVIVLTRAGGTPFADFSEQFVEKLTSWALDYARVTYPRLEPGPLLRFVLRRAYQAFVASLAAALQHFPDDGDARAAIALFTTQHQAGLKRLFESQGEADGQPHRSGKTPPVVAKAAGARARNTRSADADSGAARPSSGQADRARRTRRRS
jgi:AcrR family transcriptional regulator